MTYVRPAQANHAIKMTPLQNTQRRSTLHSGLTDRMARTVNKYITSNPISLIPIEGFVDTHSVKNKKRKMYSDTEETVSTAENEDESDSIGI